MSHDYAANKNKNPKVYFERYISSSDEQVSRELHYTEVARMAKLDMAALEINIALIKEKINIKRQLLGLPPVVNTSIHIPTRTLS